MCSNYFGKFLAKKSFLELFKYTYCKTNAHGIF